MKECTACRQSKDESEFYRTGDYVFPRCKVCYKLQVKKWKKENAEVIRVASRMRRLRNPEKARQAARDYYRRNPEAVKASVRRGQLKFPEKEAARKLLKQWVKDGKLIRPDRCMVCGEKSDRIDGHHPDHSRPFAVVWCCKQCHADLDRKAA